MGTTSKTNEKIEQSNSVPKLRIPDSCEPFIPPICSLLASGVYIVLGAVVVSKIETTPGFRVSYVNQSLPLKLRDHLEREKQHDLEVEWGLWNSIMFAFTTVTTIGYGTVTPKTAVGKILTCIYGGFGIPLFGLSMANLGRFFAEFTWICIYGAGRFGRRLRKAIDPRPPANWTKISPDGSRKISITPSEKNHQALHMDKPVPAPLISVLFLFWLSLGMALFPEIQRLSYLDSLYFSFVSLTTIGYGDFFPQDQSYFILVIMYLSVGLALNLMAIEVMGEWLQKFHYLGRGPRLKAPSRVPVWLGQQKLELRDLAKLIAKECDVSPNKLRKVMGNCDEIINRELVRRRKEGKGGLEVQFFYRDSQRGPRRSATAVRPHAPSIHPASAECYQISLETD